MHCTLDELFERNPAYVPLYTAVLAYCTQERAYEDALEQAESARTSSFQIQSAAAVLETLQRRGGLQVRLLVDGEPYEGTLRDLQADDAVDPQAQVEQLVLTTPQGAALLEAHDSNKLLGALFAQQPGFVGGFKAVLAMCEGEGKTTAQIQEDLRALGELPCDPRTGVEQVHASFFTGALEHVGALEWKGGRWVTNADATAAL